MTLVFLLTLFASAHSAKHSLSYFLTASSGISSIPEFIAVSTIDDIQVAYCDSEIKRAEPRHKWVKTLLEDDKMQWRWHNYTCNAAHQVRKSDLELLNNLYNKTGGEHVLQRRTGCEWDEGKGIKGYDEYGYDGEDLISFDMETRTWSTLVKETIITESAFEVNKAVQSIVDFLNNTCPQWLKKHLDYGKNMLRTEFPSVSLLQKSPSSSVTCHATGFYPSRAEMFWRRAGVEIHENVNLSEILPNNDTTYQMSADLNVQSFTPEDWEEFECVFQFPDQKENIVLKLDKTKIKSNNKNANSSTAAVVSLLIIGIAIVAVAVGLVVSKNRKAKGRAAPLENDAELCQRLTTEDESNHMK